MADDTGPWQEFWLASELSPTTGRSFGERINDFEPVDAPPRFSYAAAPQRLDRAADALTDAQAGRHSGRAFAPGPLPARSLGRLLSAFADPPASSGGDARRRAWPSAGGLYPLEVFAFLLDVAHPLSGRSVHYEPDLHAVTDIAASPSWAELGPALTADVLEGQPQVVVAFALDTAAMEEKYGNRAGRFALIEVGHAAQNLALRLAADGLAGCELGGAHDRVITDALGLRRFGARIALAYACGLPAYEPAQRSRRARFRRR